jgi:hypothetical protein
MGKWTEQSLFNERCLNGYKNEKMLTILGHKGNANQNNIKIPPHSCWNRTQTTNVSKFEGKKKPSYTPGGNVS